MVTERLLIRDCSAFTDYEKVCRDESVLEYLHSFLDMAYSETITETYLLDIDFYTLDCSDRFERLINDSGLMTLPGNRLDRFCDNCFRFYFVGGVHGLFVSLI